MSKNNSFNILRGKYIVKKFNMRKLVLMLADIFVIVVSGFITNYVCSMAIPSAVNANFGLLYHIIINTVLCVLFLSLFGAFSRQWRFFNIFDYISCGVAMLCGNFAATGIFFLLGKNAEPMFYLVYFLISTIGVLLFRLMFRRAFLDSQHSGRIE